MGRTLLMIHGVGCGGEVWAPWRAQFEAAGYRCETPTLFPELRTAEDPPAALADLTLQDYVTEMGQVAQDLFAEEGQRPIIIGHSMGGLIAQKLCAQGLSQAGIFVTPAQPAGCTVTDLRVVRTFWSILKVGQKNIPGGVFKVGPNGFRWGVLNAVPKHRHEEIYAGAIYDSGRVYEALGQPETLDESKVQVPTLTLGAKKDRATVIKAVRNVAQKYARSEPPGSYIEYPRHAHWILDEPGSDQVARDILTWLEQSLVD